MLEDNYEDEEFVSDFQLPEDRPSGGGSGGFDLNEEYTANDINAALPNLNHGEERGSRSGLFKIAPPQISGLDRQSAKSSAKPGFVPIARRSFHGEADTNNSPSMYKNSAGLSKLGTDNQNKELSLPPLMGSGGENSPRMSIVNEGLTSKQRDSKHQRLASLKESKASRQITSGSRASLKNDGFRLPEDNNDNLDSLFAQNRYLDKSKTNSRVNLDEQRHSQSGSHGGAPALQNLKSNGQLSGRSSQQKLVNLKNRQQESALNILGSGESEPFKNRNQAASGQVDQQQSTIQTPQPAEQAANEGLSLEEEDVVGMKASRNNKIIKGGLGDRAGNLTGQEQDGASAFMKEVTLPNSNAKSISKLGKEDSEYIPQVLPNESFKKSSLGPVRSSISNVMRSTEQVPELTGGFEPSANLTQKKPALQNLKTSQDRKTTILSRTEVTENSVKEVVQTVTPVSQQIIKSKASSIEPAIKAQVPKKLNSHRSSKVATAVNQKRATVKSEDSSLNNRQVNSRGRHQSNVSESSETRRIVKINSKLKSELLTVISQMEVQLDRVKTRRRERLDAEAAANRMDDSKSKEIRSGARQKDRLKREIEEMWSELENTFNINAINKMENDLKAEKLHLMELYQDTQGSAAVRKHQNEALEEKNHVSVKLRGKASGFAAEMREAKQKLKIETEMQRKIMLDIKSKHTEILRMENRQKQISSAIKAQKDKGYSPRTSKKMLEQEQSRNENTVFRLENEVKELEDHQQRTLRDQKSAYSELTKDLKNARQQVKMLEIKLKEKDQELKLAELKVKELKKQIPSTRLKPLPTRTTRTNRTVASTDGHSVDGEAYRDSLLNRKRSNIPQPRSLRTRKYTQEAHTKKSFLTQNSNRTNSRQDVKVRNIRQMNTSAEENQLSELKARSRQITPAMTAISKQQEPRKIHTQKKNETTKLVNSISKFSLNDRDSQGESASQKPASLKPDSQPSLNQRRAKHPYDLVQRDEMQSQLTGSRLSVRSNVGKPPIDKSSAQRGSIQDHLKTLDAYTKNADIERVNVVEHDRNSSKSMKPMTEQPTNNVSKSVVGNLRESHASGVLSSVQGADIASNKPKSQIRQSNERDLLMINNQEEIKDEFGIETAQMQRSEHIVKEISSQPAEQIEIEDEDYSDNYDEDEIEDEVINSRSGN